MKLKLGIGIATLLLTSAAFAVDGFTFKQAPKQGTVLKYKQAAKLEFNGMEISYSAIETRTTLKVDPAGTFSIKQETSDAKVNDMDIPGGGGGGPTTITLNMKGEIVKLEGDEVDESAYRMANLELFIVPEKVVNPNDTWTYDIKEDKKTGVMAAKATYTFIGDDKVGETEAVKVKYTIKEAGDSGASTEGMIWIRKSDCEMVKQTAKWTNVPIPKAGPMSGDITVTLIQ